MPRGAVARPFIFAWHFLTTIPLSRVHHEPTAPELAASMAWYPVVGLLIGGGLAVADMALQVVFDGIVVNAFLIVLLVLLTRGLHQDGLADTLDGLAGGCTSVERLSIMRDPQVGALGATGLFLSLLLRYAGLMVLPRELRVPGTWRNVSANVFSVVDGKRLLFDNDNPLFQQLRAGQPSVPLVRERVAMSMSVDEIHDDAFISRLVAMTRAD